jgi:hypothetical protein
MRDQFHNPSEDPMIFTEEEVLATGTQGCDADSVIRDFANPLTMPTTCAQTLEQAEQVGDITPSCSHESADTEPSRSSRYHSGSSWSSSSPAFLPLPSISELPEQGPLKSDGEYTRHKLELELCVTLESRRAEEERTGIEKARITSLRKLSKDLLIELGWGKGKKRDGLAEGEEGGEISRKGKQKQEAKGEITTTFTDGKDADEQDELSRLNFQTEVRGGDQLLRLVQPLTLRDGRQTREVLVRLPSLDREDWYNKCSGVTSEKVEASLYVRSLPRVSSPSQSGWGGEQSTGTERHETEAGDQRMKGERTYDRFDRKLLFTSPIRCILNAGRYTRERTSTFNVTFEDVADDDVKDDNGPCTGFESGDTSSRRTEGILSGRQNCEVRLGPPRTTDRSQWAKTPHRLPPAQTAFKGVDELLLRPINVVGDREKNTLMGSFELSYFRPLPKTEPVFES